MRNTWQETENFIDVLLFLYVIFIAIIFVALTYFLVATGNEESVALTLAPRPTLAHTIAPTLTPTPTPTQRPTQPYRPVRIVYPTPMPTATVIPYIAPTSLIMDYYSSPRGLLVMSEAVPGMGQSGGRGSSGGSNCGSNSIRITFKGEANDETRHGQVTYHYQRDADKNDKITTATTDSNCRLCQYRDTGYSGPKTCSYGGFTSGLDQTSSLRIE